MDFVERNEAGFVVRVSARVVVAAARAAFFGVGWRNWEGGLILWGVGVRLGTDAA